MEVGLSRFWNDVRKKRYRFRQAVGGFFCAYLVVLARPVGLWVFVVGAMLCAIGALIRLWAAGHVRKNELLETRGPYAFVRHPQYLGNCFLATGVCLASGHLWAIVIWAVVFHLFYVPAVRREDDRLHRHFGRAWEAWGGKTPPIVPTHWPAGGGFRVREWSLLQSLRNGEYVWLGLLTTGMVTIYLRIV